VGWAHDAKVIALIAAAHLTSHVHLMLLPPIFGLVRDAFGVSYVEIGVALTAYNVASAALQTPAGFLVDRIGPRAMLTGGLLLAAAALTIAALLPGYTLFVVAYAFLGLANTVYHPADYSILAATIDAKRIGKAFSVHNFSGYLGSGVAPAMVLGSAALWGGQGAFLLARGAGDRLGAVADRGRRRAAHHPPAAGRGPTQRQKDIGGGLDLR
jgi:MFS family permease